MSILAELGTRPDSRGRGCRGRTAAFVLGTLCTSFLVLSFLTAAVGEAQERTGEIVVRVQLPDRSPFDQGAAVNLYNFSGAPVATATTVRGGQAQFENLPKATYSLEVLAPGFEKYTQTVEISTNGDHQTLFVTLMPLPGRKPVAAPAGPPILAPNAQKELNKALESVRGDKLEEARKSLEKVTRGAPSNPDLNYLWGMYYAQKKDWNRAGGYWEKAIQVYPRHAFSLGALGHLAEQNGDLPAAIDFFARAAEALPSSWHFQARLAEAYLLHNEYDQAQKHAERAIELGKDRAASAQLVLAKALLHKNERELAGKALNTLLAGQASSADRDEALKLREPLQQPATTSKATAPGPAFAGGTAEAAKAGPMAPSHLRDELLPPVKWMPPDVDESMPAVESGTACPLQTIQDQAAKRVRDFVDDVNRISATEALEHEVIDRYGLTTKRETRKFSYVESLQEVKPGMYRVEEYRNGTMGLDAFPDRLASLGLGSLVMIFHPAYRDEYDVSCEGLSHWHGASAWQVHFRQKPDRPARLHEYSVSKQVFSVSLRGRAWIATDTYQIISLETDIVAPVPQIRLKAEHIAIEYTPVRFRKGNEELWLPRSAELFFDFNGRRIHRRHHFDDYRLFSVDERQTISEPSTDSDVSSAAPSSQ